MPRNEGDITSEIFTVEDLVYVTGDRDGGNAYSRGPNLVYRIMSFGGGDHFGRKTTVHLEDVEDGWRSNNIHIQDLKLTNRLIWADRLEQKMLPILNERVSTGVNRVEKLRMEIAILREYKSDEDSAEEILKKYGIAGLRAAGFAIVRGGLSASPCLQYEEGMEPPPVPQLRRRNTPRAFRAMPTVPPTLRNPFTTDTAEAVTDTQMGSGDGEPWVSPEEIEQIMEDVTGADDDM